MTRILPNRPPTDSLSSNRIASLPTAAQGIAPKPSQALLAHTMTGDGGVEIDWIAVGNGLVQLGAVFVYIADTPGRNQREMINGGLKMLANHNEKVNDTFGKAGVGILQHNVAMKTLDHIASQEPHWVVRTDPQTNIGAVYDIRTKQPIAGMAMTDNGLGVRFLPAVKQSLTRDRVEDGAKVTANDINGDRRANGLSTADPYRLQGVLIDYAMKRLSPTATGSEIAQVYNTATNDKSLAAALVDLANGKSSPRAVGAEEAKPRMTWTEANAKADTIISDRVDSLLSESSVSNTLTDVTELWPYQDKVDGGTVRSQVLDRATRIIKGSLQGVDLTPEQYPGAIETQAGKLDATRIRSEIRNIANSALPGGRSGPSEIYTNARNELLSDLTEGLSPRQAAKVEAQLESYIDQRRPGTAHTVDNMIALLQDIKSSPGLRAGWVKDAIGERTAPISTGNTSGETGATWPLPSPDPAQPRNLPPTEMPPQMPPYPVPPATGDQAVPPPDIGPRLPPQTPPQQFPPPIGAEPLGPDSPLSPTKPDDDLIKIPRPTPEPEKEPDKDPKVPVGKIAGAGLAAWLVSQLGGTNALFGTAARPTRIGTDANRDVDATKRDLPEPGFIGYDTGTGNPGRVMYHPVPEGGNSTIKLNKNFKVGSKVREGDVLYWLRDPKLQGEIKTAELEVASARKGIQTAKTELSANAGLLRKDIAQAQESVASQRANVASASTAVTVAEGEYKRYEGLGQQDVVADVVVVQKLSELNVAKGTLARAEEGLSRAENTLEKAQLKLSRMSGVLNKDVDTLIASTDLPPSIDAAVQKYETASATLAGLRSDKAALAVRASVSGTVVSNFPAAPGSENGYARTNFSGYTGGLNPQLVQGDPRIGNLPYVNPEGPGDAFTVGIRMDPVQVNNKGEQIKVLAPAIRVRGVDGSLLGPLQDRIGDRVTFQLPDGSVGSGKIGFVGTPVTPSGVSVRLDDLQDAQGNTIKTIPASNHLVRVFFNADPKTVIDVDNGDQVAFGTSGVESTRQKLARGSEEVTVRIPVFIEQFGGAFSTADGSSPGLKVPAGHVVVKYTVRTDGRTVDIRNAQVAFEAKGSANASGTEIEAVLSERGGRVRVGGGATNVEDSMATLRIKVKFASQKDELTLSTGPVSQGFKPTETEKLLEFDVVPSGRQPMIIDPDSKQVPPQLTEVLRLPTEIVVPAAGVDKKS
ncbi:MAG: hypothetical protein AAFR73_13095 [Pseudomonadota bacterium]